MSVWGCGRYTIKYDVWAHPIVNTAHKAYCSTTDSNGLLDITEVCVVATAVPFCAAVDPVHAATSVLACNTNY